MHRQKVPRDVRIGLEFLAQLHHVRVHRPRIRKRLVSPDGIQDHVARQRTVRVLEEVSQQVILGRRQLQLVAAPRDYAAVQIDFRVREVKDLVRVRRSTAQQRPDPCQQLARAEGLDYVIVGADLEQQYLIHLIAHRAQHDDRRLDLRRSKLLADIHATHAGQAQINQHQVWLQQQGFLESLAAVGDQYRPEALLLEQYANGVA